MQDWMEKPHNINLVDVDNPRACVSSSIRCCCIFSSSSLFTTESVFEALCVSALSLNGLFVGGLDELEVLKSFTVQL